MSVDLVAQSRKLSVYSLLLPSKQRWLGSRCRNLLLRVACADDWDQSGLQQGHWLSVQGDGLHWLICLHRSDISFGYAIWISCTEPASGALGAVVLGQIDDRVKHTNMALRGQKLRHSSLVQSLILLCYTGQIMMLPLCLLTSKIGIITHVSLLLYISVQDQELRSVLGVIFIHLTLENVGYYILPATIFSLSPLKKSPTRITCI